MLRTLAYDCTCVFVLETSYFQCLSQTCKEAAASSALPLSHSHGKAFMRLSGCMWRWMNETSLTHKTQRSTHTHALVNNPAGSTLVFLYR